MDCSEKAGFNRHPWIVVQVSEGMTLRLPGIYAWQIGDDCYVGKSCRPHRRFGEYPNNVRKLLSQLPYRKGGGKYRRVHHALAQAKRRNGSVTFRLLENCLMADLNRRERHWISRIATLND